MTQPAQRLRLAVVGFGRLGRACVAALHERPDLALAGVVRRAESLAGPPQPRPDPAPHGLPCVAHVRDLPAVDAVLLCVPAAAATGQARELLQARLPVVDCAALEGRALQEHEEEIAHAALRHRTRAVVGAGWDPGVLPQLQRLFERLIPQGRTQRTTHVGASLHHTAAAHGVAGVRGALCTERRAGDGRLQRYVYVQLAPGAAFAPVREAIAGDPLFADGTTEVLPVDDLAALEAPQAGTLIERQAEGTGAPHASLILEARADPLAFTARLMLDAVPALAAQGNGGWRYTPFGLARL